MDIPDTCPPNGPGYTTTETRTGPPLRYVAEKLHYAIVILHSFFKDVRREVPDNLPCPEALLAKYPRWNTKEGLLSSCHSVFRLAMTGYLALNNMLGLTGDQRVFERLLAMPHADFKCWLDHVRREGSVVDEPPKADDDDDVPFPGEDEEESD